MDIDRPVTSRRWFRFGGILLAALPVALLLGVLARACVNIPVGDDCFSLLPFLCDWKESTTVAEHWRLLTEQYIAHRIIFTRLLAVLDLRIFGEFNLIALQAIGWLGWIATAAGLVCTLPSIRRDPWLALPVTLLLMHAEGYTNLLCAIGMGNLWVVAFAFFAAACAFSPRRGVFALSFLFAALSAAAFASGLLVFPAVFCGLVVRRQFARAAWFLAIGAAVWLAYFHGYHSPLAPLALAELFQKAAIMAGGFVILGRTPDVAALAAGAFLLLLALGLLCVPRLWRELPAHGAFLVFAIMSVFTAARGRVGWGNYYMLQDRYRLYGLLLVSVGYLVAGEWFAPHRRRIGLAAANAAVVYCLLAYVTFFATLRSAQRWCEATALNAQLGENFPCTIPADWDAAGQRLRRAELLGVYRLPAFLSAADLAAARALPMVATEPRLCDLEPNGGVCGYHVGVSADGSRAAPQVPDFGLLVLPDRRVILPVDEYRVRFADLLSRFSLLSGRFGLILPRSQYSSPGRHAVYGLRRGADGRLAVAWSGTVTIP